MSEPSRLFHACAEGSALESFSLKGITVISILLLRKQARNSKAQEHLTCLERCMKTWLDGDVNNLVLEGRSLCLQKVVPCMNGGKNLIRPFFKLMFKAK